jgi:HD-like signal output (HDOD) protein
MLLRGKIGAMVLEKWDFSPELVTVARDSANWLRDSDTDFDYCDLVQVASLYAAQEGDLADMPEMHSVPAFQKLALTQEQANEVITTAQEQISEFRQIFQHRA